MVDHKIPLSAGLVVALRHSIPSLWHSLGPYFYCTSTDVPVCFGWSLDDESAKKERVCKSHHNLPSPKNQKRSFAHNIIMTHRSEKRGQETPF